jgi:hypothetical protein
MIRKFRHCLHSGLPGMRFIRTRRSIKRSRQSLFTLCTTIPEAFIGSCRHYEENCRHGKCQVFRIGSCKRQIDASDQENQTKKEICCYRSRHRRVWTQTVALLQLICQSKRFPQFFSANCTTRYFLPRHLTTIGAGSSTTISANSNCDFFSVFVAMHLIFYRTESIRL